MAITGYFDESYNHPSKSDPDPPRVYTVAGYISTVEKWCELLPLWNKVLSDKGVDVFHLSKFEAREGVYKGWTNEERISFYSRLQILIRRKTLKGFSMSLKRSDYDDLFTGTAREGFGSHHTFLVLMCMAMTSDWLARYRPDEQIIYIFEKGCGFEGEVNDLFEAFAKNKTNSRKFHLAEPKAWGWGDKKIVPLQAADVNAGESNKLAVRWFKRGEGKEIRNVRESIKKLAMSPHDYKYWRREDLALFISDAREAGWIE